MTAAEAVQHLAPCLAPDNTGRYRFACKKAFVAVKLFGESNRFRFHARDRLVFRMEADCFTIEKQDSGAIQRQFRWEQIEFICGGEPEKDDGSLFQG